VRTAIRKNLRNFAAIIGLALVALVVAGVILSHQRFYLPQWVPVLGSDFVDYKADFTTAQSVTPGQGQTVNVAGVPVGEITKVDLVDGHAVVTMEIHKRFTPIYKDATALLRPKTGLNDMIVELTPGHRRAGAVPHGWTIPINQTLPNINFDEVLASLDTDTREYLKMLIGGAGQALAGNGRNLAATFKRFAPTARALSQINGALVARRQNIRVAIHNFSLLARAVGEKDQQIAQLVDSSNTVFRAFARQDQNLRSTLGLLPGTLQTADTTFAKVDKLGKVLGPTLGALRPAARALGPTLRATRPFVRDTMPVIRDELRPFSRDALPTVQLLRPAVRDLAVVTPKLTTTLRVVNYLFNELAYKPPGQQPGYLFWVAWANHDGAQVFSTQDAHGPIRRGELLASCGSLAGLDNIYSANPGLGLLSFLTNLPKSSAVCPKSSQAPTSGG
jgi:phospholipid/cholesterol/gamma-HCH transport system substrate-binding protein